VLQLSGLDSPKVEYSEFCDDGDRECRITGSTDSKAKLKPLLKAIEAAILAGLNSLK
jgi:hypothetical protein